MELSERDYDLIQQGEYGYIRLDSDGDPRCGIAGYDKEYVCIMPDSIWNRDHALIVIGVILKAIAENE